MARRLSGTFNLPHLAPPVPRAEVADIYYGHRILDPYRPLENLHAPETRQWAAAQNKRLRLFLKDAPGKKKAAADLAFLSAIPAANDYDRHDGKYFSIVKNGTTEQGVLQVRKGLNGKVRTIIDPNPLSRDHTVAIEDYALSPSGKLIAYTLRHAGSDLVTMHVKRTATGEDLPDVITNLRFSCPVWEDDKSFYYRAQVPHERRLALKLHVLGTDPKKDKLVFERPESGTIPILSSISGSSWEWVSVTADSNDRNGLWARNPATEKNFREIFPYGRADYDLIEQRHGKVYMLTTFGAPRGRVVRFDPTQPDPAHWETVIAEHPRDILRGAFFQQGKLFVTAHHAGSKCLKIFDSEGRYLRTAALPARSDFNIISNYPQDKSFLMQIGNDLKPPSLYKYSIAADRIEPLEPSPPAPGLEHCITETLYAPSRDGTIIPVTVLRDPRVRLDGTAALKLGAYGGYRVMDDPEYAVSVAQWLRAGGIYAWAHIRGGSYYGQDWYEKGRGKNKENSFDDLAASAWYLANRHYTSSQRIALQGRSNGGMTVLATMLKNPELFGAVIAEVPVTDMLRYARHTFAHLWKDDFGDPETREEDFKVSRHYSPLHNIRKGALYPPMLLTTADHDTRVVPSHAYKFAATMQERAHPDTICLVRTEHNAGHGNGNLPQKKYISLMSDIFAFTEKAIGPVDQDEYVRTRKQKQDLKDTPPAPRP